MTSGFESNQWSEVLSATGTEPLCFATGWPITDAVIKAGDELPLLYITKAEE